MIEGVPEKLAFYELQISQIEWTIEDIKTRGIIALHEIDKSKGVDEAIRMLNEQLIYFKKAKKDYMSQQSEKKA